MKNEREGLGDGGERLKNEGERVAKGREKTENGWAET